MHHLPSPGGVLNRRVEFTVTGHNMLDVSSKLPGGVLNHVEFKTTGHMLDVSSKLPDKTCFCCLNSISIGEDAIANDVIYHNLCWAKAKKKDVPKQKPAEKLNGVIQKDVGREWRNS